MSESVENRPKTVRIDYERNHLKISKAFKKLAAKIEGLPTYQEIADETGFDVQTVFRHFKEYKLSDYKDKFKALTPDVIFSLYKMATKKNNPRAAALFMKLIENFSEKTVIDVNINEKVTGFQYVTPDQIQEAEIVEDEPEDD